MLPARHSSASILLLLAEFCAFSGVGYSTSRAIRKQIIVVWLLYALVRGENSGGTQGGKQRLFMVPELR
jgi:hypothetical protein